VSAICAAACGSARGTTARVPPAPIDVRLQADEAVAALSIVRARAAGTPVAPDDWQRLFSSQGYLRLAEREAFMGRAFTDSSFARFVASDTVAARYDALARTLGQLERIDVSAAAARAHAYLPPGTPLRAVLYLEIKPITNSFVFTGRDSTPSIFLYVRTADTPAQVENTMAHELHHIGLSAACPERPSSRATPAQQMLLRFLTAYGEGQAMLAAAGGPDAHPHAADPDSIRRRWDADVARAPADVATQSAFFRAVIDGRITSADSVRTLASSYFGVQGPWYTVGWLMASTIEREFGRSALVATLCDPPAFMARYDQAAARRNARGSTLPLWDAALIAELQRLAK
jgi:Putative zinc dependent peptidase (DUF5700)